MRRLTEKDIAEILELHTKGNNPKDIVSKTGFSASTVYRTIAKFTEAEMPGEEGDTPDRQDKEILEENDRLAKKVQRFMDRNRIERKSYREFARADNMILEMHNALNDTMQHFNVSTYTSKKKQSNSKKIGVIQLSDLHFGELVSGLTTNSFDINIASKRIEKLISKAKDLFLAQEISDVAVFMTGDMINSSRRISEITEYAAARTNVVVLAMDIIQQAILDLNEDFNVTVATVVGNESRTGDYFDTTDFLASDNYDAMLHNLLARLFKDSESVKFLSIENPIEKVVDLNGVKFLLLHGNAHRGLSATRNIEVEVEKVKARYASGGVKIDYVICGHIHSTMLSNNYSRSASLVGSNHYSERTLNFNSKASQNLFIVHCNDIDAIMIDLQDVDGYDGYNYDKKLVRYFSDKDPKSTVVIQSVLI